MINQTPVHAMPMSMSILMLLMCHQPLDIPQNGNPLKKRNIRCTIIRRTQSSTNSPTKLLSWRSIIHRRPDPSLTTFSVFDINGGDVTLTLILSLNLSGNR